MLYISAVESGTLELVKQLMSLEVLKDARLVGGTALALQLLDLDLFGNIEIGEFDIKNP